MNLYVNDRNEVHAVGSTEDESLRLLVITDDTFKDWSEAKLCCYCVTADEAGRVTSMWPYVNTVIIEQLDRLGENAEQTDGQVTDLQMAMVDVYEITDAQNTINQQQITDLELAVVDLYEMIGG